MAREPCILPEVVAQILLCFLGSRKRKRIRPVVALAGTRDLAVTLGGIEKDLAGILLQFDRQSM